MNRARPAAALAIVAGTLALTSTAVHGQEAELKVSVSGTPEVGKTLHADVIPAGDHKYVWRRCRSRALDSCAARIGSSPSLRLTNADLGRWIRVRVTQPSSDPEPDPDPEPTSEPEPTPDGMHASVSNAAAAAASVWSEPVGPVRAPPASPAPSPSPQPTPDTPAAPPPAFTLQGASPTLSLAPRFLDPFPVVRIRGTVAKRGARVSLLRVTGPHRATVKVRCKGARCPIKRRARRPGRLRAFERFLPAGLRITVLVRREAHIGKYVRLKIRAGKPPARRDACVVPGEPRPVTCPPA